MTSKPSSDEPMESALRKSGDDVGVIEIKELAWEMLDDQISETGLSRLEELLNGSDAGRNEYLRCVQLHVDLQDFFANELPMPERTQASARSPVLGFLNSGSLPLDMGSHARNS